jgi:hypothetical protein
VPHRTPFIARRIVAVVFPSRILIDHQPTVMLVPRLCARGAALRVRGVPCLHPSTRRPGLILARNATSGSNGGSTSASRILPGVAWGLHYSPPDGSPHTPSGTETDLPEAHRNVDAIVVLAGGQTGPDSVPPWVERRLDTALSLQRLQRRPVPILSLGERAGGVGTRSCASCSATMELMRKHC